VAEQSTPDQRGTNTATAADANGSTPVPSAEELNVLRTKAAERDQYLDLAQRTQADFENYRRSLRDRQEQERRMMLAHLVRDMLPVFDNLELALHAAREAGEKGPLVQGVHMVQTQFLDVLRRYGVQPIDAQGKPFDHNLHEAVAQQPAPDQPPNTVIQVLAPGFRLDDWVLRPAKVVVSAPASSERGASAPESGSGG
jgi:molecular chaperone GrpE